MNVNALKNTVTSKMQKYLEDNPVRVIRASELVEFINRDMTGQVESRQMCGFVQSEAGRFSARRFYGKS